MTTVDGSPVALVWPPPAEEVCECHAIALVAEPASAREAIPHFLTLEVGAEPEDGRDRTIFCGWRQRGEDFDHFNCGDGPAPTRDAFLEAVRGYLESAA